VIELVLPWPSKDLSQNARGHWAIKARATKAARKEAAVLAIAAGWQSIVLPAGALHLWLNMYRPSHRKFDDDGVVGRFKPYRDGLADALGIDDSRFRVHPVLHDEVRNGGQIVVRITGGADAAD